MNMLLFNFEMKFLFIFSLLIFFDGLSQMDEYKGNTWSSILYRHNISDAKTITFDAGYRWFDGFVKRRRQDLIRVQYDCKLDSKNNVGLGFAIFESVLKNSENFRTEYRPYVQYQWGARNEKEVFNVRFRNEFRYYFAVKEMVNRARLQLSYEYKIVSSYLVPKVSIEGFVSAQKTPSIEQRYSIGNTFTFSKMASVYAFYTLQFQSNINYNGKLIQQNIVGLQLILNTSKQ